MKWIKLDEKLPPANSLVWVKRCATVTEDAPIYLGMRNGEKISNNPDPSKNCNWYGVHSKSLALKQPNHIQLKFTYSFSDVTVIEWAFIEIPI